MKKNFRNWIYLLVVIGAFLMLTNGCGKDDNNNDNPILNETVTDIDGNVYHTVKIGTQVWMVEDLKTTKYNDGTSIPTWDRDESQACYGTYDEEDVKNGIKGVFYNWYAVNTGKLAPTGWHVASDAEWTTMTTFLGGLSVAGGKLKETTNTHWNSPNTGATNESGFTALPGGTFYHNEIYYVNVGERGYWWTSTPFNASTFGDQAIARYISFDDSAVEIHGESDKKNGYSVRCIKN